MELALGELRGQRSELANTNRRLDDIHTALQMHQTEHATLDRARATTSQRSHSWKQNRQLVLSTISGPLAALLIFVGSHFWQNPPTS